MKFASRFLNQFSGLVVCLLSCFDRVMFKGYLPFHSEFYLNSWVDYELGIRRTEFIKQLDQKSQELVDHAKTLAEQAGRPYEYRQGWFRKEQFIQRIVQRDQVSRRACGRAVCAGDLSHCEAGSWRQATASEVRQAPTTSVVLLLH